MPVFSIIVPVYNRISEVKELLESLTVQTDKDFEVIIAEDGSIETSEKAAEAYRDKLNIKYYFKENSGPGLTRNFGTDKASGDYFIYFDSDCIIPDNYISTVRRELTQRTIDCYGGPDKAHASFTSLQKAINYSMTSFITTGGIRGGKKKLDKFYPRSFNMGFSKKVYEKTRGFSSMRFGEDVDFSLRVIENGFRTGLIEEAYVFHKRRTGFFKFFKQVYNSGIARINLYKRHPKSLKLIHMLPSAFVIFIFLIILLSLFNYFFLSPIIFLGAFIFADSYIKNKDAEVASLSIISSFIQLIGYGSGFIYAFVNRIVLGKDEFNAFNKNFYK